MKHSFSLLITAENDDTYSDGFKSLFYKQKIGTAGAMRKYLEMQNTHIFHGIKISLPEPQKQTYSLG